MSGVIEYAATGTVHRAATEQVPRVQHELQSCLEAARSPLQS